MLIHEDCKISGYLPLNKRRILLYNDKLDESTLNYVILCYRLETNDPICEIKIMDSKQKYYSNAYCWICGGGSMTIIFLNINDTTIEYNYHKDEKFSDVIPSKKSVKRIIMYIKNMYLITH